MDEEVFPNGVYWEFPMAPFLPLDKREFVWESPKLFDLSSVEERYFEPVEDEGWKTDGLSKVLTLALMFLPPNLSNKDPGNFDLP